MSRFVSAGSPDGRPLPRDEDWAQAQREVESRRQQPVPEQGRQEGGKSLYEVLQQNKAAKQEAFEESIRLKNQIRALDADEVDFLDSVLESSRAQEAAVRQETAEHLEAFRKQRAAADQQRLLQEQAASDKAPRDTGRPDEWTTKKKKRRRDKDSEGPAIGSSKLRKHSERAASPTGAMVEAANARGMISTASAYEARGGDDDGGDAAAALLPPPPQQSPSSQHPPSKLQQPGTTIGLGLGEYGSDDD